MTTEQPSTLIGKQFGPYAIQALLGSGGMGHVYRGFDQSLERPVAIKVLTEAAAAQPGLAERFRQEARLIARLQHPHIVQVYAFGEEDGITYMVEQLLPGPTLGERLKELATRGERFSREQILAMTAQLAGALDAAHAAGIIHRDLKPANALWNTNGELVLTDFGIARQILTDMKYTQTGTIIGTPHYLSPEQARGLNVTPASDIYSFGVVLYELIAGKVPFEGETPMTVVLEHIQSPPPSLAPLRPDLPPAVDVVVQRALAKEPSERFASAGAVAQALEQAWSGGKATQVLPPSDIHDQATSLWSGAPPANPAPADTQTPSAPTPAAAPPAPAPEAPAVAPAAATPAPASRPVRRLPLVWLLGGLLLLLLLGGLALALNANAPTDTAADPEAAPAGALTPPPPGLIAFASDRASGALDIYAMSGDGSDPRNLTSDAGSSAAPVWSPNRQMVAFHSDQDGDFDIYVMHADGSDPRNLTNNDSDEQEPAWSPDGQTLAFTSNRDGNAEIYLMNADGSDPRNLSNNPAMERTPAWSPDGQTIAFVTDRDGNAEIYLMNADGSNARNRSNNPANERFPAWSPDGQTIAFTSDNNGNAEIYLSSVSGGNVRNLTNAPGRDTQPTWSPDGQFIAFTSDRDGNSEIYLMAADGSNPRNISNDPAQDQSPNWSR
jgi:hypothetical protein